MYRSFTFHLTDVPLPVTAYTKLHPTTRVVAYNVGREGDVPLPAENLYIIRAPNALHAEMRALFDRHFDVIRHIDSPEPGVLLIHARFRFPSGGPLTGFLSVLAQAVGTILHFQPIVIERGDLEVSLISLPRSDSQLRLRALEQYAAEKHIGFRLVEDRALPHLPIHTPRLTILDLLEWQIVQALDAAGVYTEGEGAAPDIEAITTDLADALGLDEEDVRTLAYAAERKILREFVSARAENLRLATPPRREAPPDEPSEA